MKTGSVTKPAPTAVSPENGVTPTWHVLGAGAMGCLWASALADTQAVCLVLKDSRTRDNYPGFVRQIDGRGRTVDVPIPAEVPATLDTGSVQRLLLCCKAQDAQMAIASVQHALSADSVIVLLQNGCEFQQTLTAARPPGTVFCLSTSAGAWLREPFVVIPAGQGQSWLGHLDTRAPKQSDERALALLAELPATRMAIRFEPRMSHRLWQKLAVNCAINALTVVHDCRNGELLTRPEAFAQLKALCHEISGLYDQLPETPDLPDLFETVSAVARGTADNISSTLQDVRRGKTTEIEHLNGFLVRLAMRHRQPCPLNIALLDAVRQRESGPQ